MSHVICREERLKKRFREMMFEILDCQTLSSLSEPERKNSVYMASHLAKRVEWDLDSRTRLVAIVRDLMPDDQTASTLMFLVRDVYNSTEPDDTALVALMRDLGETACYSRRWLALAWITIHIRWKSRTVAFDRKSALWMLRAFIALISKGRKKLEKETAIRGADYSAASSLWSYLYVERGESPLVEEDESLALIQQASIERLAIWSLQASQVTPMGWRLVARYLPDDNSPLPVSVDGGLFSRFEVARFANWEKQRNGAMQTLATAVSRETLPSAKEVLTRWSEALESNGEGGLVDLLNMYQ